MAHRHEVAHRTYETDAIRVSWDSSRCIHTARCLNALPSVFDVRARPWVDIEGADADSIAAAVETCPTGALLYKRLDGAQQEQPHQPTVAVPIPDGPLLVAGELQVIDADGNTIAEETRLTLCRCGRTKNQPFCDNSHLMAGFRSSDFEAHETSGEHEAAAGKTTITATRDGSLHFEGGVTVIAPSGETLDSADDLWLCRCGRSNSKPFCDSSHRQGFQSEVVQVTPHREQADSPAAFEKNENVPAQPAGL